jgi:hypothetical protein
MKPSIRDHLRNLFFPLKPKPPVINTRYGDTTEWCRLQAALNMKADHGKRAEVEALLAKECGSEIAGLYESRRRYPEAYE